ncbi:glycosyltransferase [Tropicibacter oceani]|uniref:Glycosyltransferase n=1 Tax=Tropicibacter oceani TaxID=3058420 RepID=A0ABY8QNK4_9RHOB|nr:glycosyltransferase [Tropicibacter oceani]WGW06043.1 glycosyltransferase [Tropicibacter oceani]
MAVGTDHGAGRLVAVVVTYNRLAQLQVTVPRLLASPKADLAAVVVVDNASDDGTAEWLSGQEGDPRLTVIRCKTNLGGAGGFETGMREAVKRFDPDWIVVMDDDARPEPGALARFHASDRSGAEAWAAAVYHLDGRICDMNRPSINPFWHRKVLWRTLTGKGRDGFHIGQAEYGATTPCGIDGASFVGLFVSRAGIERVGYPDGRLFIYGDDVLYTLGLTRAGGRILFDPTIRFEHDFSTMTDADKRFRPLWKSYYHYRNLLMVYRMASGWLFPLVLVAAAGKWLLKVRHHSGERRAFVLLVLRALRDGLLRRTDVPHDRVVGWAQKRP